MPLVVVCTSAVADLSIALTEAHIQGDIRYLLASAPTAEKSRNGPPFNNGIPTSFADMPNVGLVFIAVNPEVESDLTVACEVSRAARTVGLFVVALLAQMTSSRCNRVSESALLREFDSIINLRKWARSRLLACDVIGHLAGGLKVAPPVCTDLADVQAILRGAIVSVGVGEAIGSPNLHEAGTGRDAAELAIRDVGHSQVASATGVIVVIAGNHSVRLSEISRVTHQVGDLVTSDNAAVIPSVHIEPDMRDHLKVMLLTAHRAARSQT